MNTGALAGSGVHEDLVELRRPGLTRLCLAGLFVAWLWIAVAARGIFFDEPQQVATILAPAWLFIGCAAGLLLRGLPLGWRSTFLLTGLGGTFVLSYLASPAPMWLYGQSLTAAVAGLLAGLNACSVVVALLTLASILCFWRDPTAVSLIDFGAALSLLWAMTLISRLSSQNLYTALGWALHSQERAWQTANEVRTRRAELRRTLDSLKVTQGILERTLSELEAARLEAEEARQVKSRFVANISHELRTPLNVIVGFAEMLCTLPETYGDFPWPAALRQDLLSIWRNAEHLLSMVDDVLDLAQIEAARLPVLPEMTDLAQLIRNTLSSTGSLLRDAKLELRVSLPEDLPPINVDRARIRQVLLNLLSNAVRFTRQGYIEVGAHLVDQEIHLYVRDSGQGIPPAKLETIFQEFEQADTSIRRPHQGAGLGLAISRHFVRLHGGRMWAESELGKGSTFHFSLPLADSAAFRSLQPGRAVPEYGRQVQEARSIVALCADPLVVRLLERHLENIKVYWAQTLSAAVALVHDRHPDAVLVAAESSNGLDVAQDQARELIEAVAPFDLPILACSFPTERHAGMALGVSEFLLKPVTHKEVVEAIRRLHSAPQRILIVDDEPDMLRLLTRIVEHEWTQAEVLTAASGDDAIAMLPQKPDVILLDLLMPGTNGVAVLRELHANPEMAGIPVAVITARGPAEDLGAAQRGELHIIKGAGFAAGELVRVLGLMMRGLPPRYAAGRALQGL